MFDEKTLVPLSEFFKSADWLPATPTVSPEPLNALSQAGWDKPQAPQTEVKQVPVQQQHFKPLPNGGLTQYAQTIQAPQVVHAGQGKPLTQTAPPPAPSPLAGSGTSRMVRQDVGTPIRPYNPTPYVLDNPQMAGNYAQPQPTPPAASKPLGPQSDDLSPSNPSMQGWQENHAVRESISPVDFLLPTGLIGRSARFSTAPTIRGTEGLAAAGGRTVTPSGIGLSSKTVTGTAAPAAAKTAPMAGAGAAGAKSAPATGTIPYATEASVGAAKSAPAAASSSGIAPARGYLSNPVVTAADWLMGTKALRSALAVPYRLLRGPTAAASAQGATRAGSAANAAVTSSVASVPPTLAVTGGMAAANRGDNSAVNEAIKNDPIKRHLFMGAPRSNTETVLNHAMMPFSILGGTLGVTDGPGLRTWFKDVGQGYSDLAGAAAHSPRRAGNAVMNQFKDFSNRFISGAPFNDTTNPAAQYEQLNNEYKNLYSRMESDPKFTADQFQAEAARIRDAISKLDFDPVVDSTGSNTVVDLAAKEEALDRWAAAHAGDPRVAEIVAKARENLKAFHTQPKPTFAAKNPFPTARQLANLPTQQGLPDVHGVPPVGAEGLAKAYAERIARSDTFPLDSQLTGAPVRPEADVTGAPAPAQQVGGPGAVPDEPPVQPPAAGEGELPPGMANPDMPPKQVQESRKAISGLIASTGVAGALAAADQLPRPAGFEKYWGSLPKSSKILAVAGVSMVGISLLRGMFSSSKGDGKDDDEDDESFLMQVLPFLGIGAAAWAVGGGTFSELPKVETYRQFGNAVADQVGSLFGKK